METTIKDIDIKTVMNLLAEGHVPAEVGILLIAEACDIDPEKLTQSLFSSSLASDAKKEEAKFTPWSKNDEVYVLEAWNRGDSIKDISDFLNRTKSAVRGRLAILQKQGHKVNQRRALSTR